MLRGCYSDRGGFSLGSRLGETGHLLHLSGQLALNCGMSQ